MTDPLIKEIRVRCSAAHAFDVFTDRVDLWWPPSHRPAGTEQMQLEAREGGAFYAVRGNGRVELGAVLEVERPRRLRYTWNPGRGAGPTLVVVDFVDCGAETLVRVTHLEADSELVDEWHERVRIFDRAWDEVLRHFEDFVDSQSEE